MVSLSGVRLLGAFFDSGGATGPFQQAVFQFTDVVLTAGRIGGGSATIHQLLALIDDFLKASRRDSENRRVRRSRRSASVWASASSLSIFRTSREFVAKPMT